MYCLFQQNKAVGTIRSLAYNIFKTFFLAECIHATNTNFCYIIIKTTVFERRKEILFLLHEFVKKYDILVCFFFHFDVGI